MRILPIYDSRKGGWLDSEGKLSIEADTVLIGPEVKPWMTKIAMVEMGQCTAKEAIAEVIHEYHIKQEGNT